MGALRHSDRYTEKTDTKSVNARTMIRRMVVGLTNAALWALEATRDEKDTDVEVFSNVGFYSRPPDDAQGEVIVVKVGASTRHAVVIASRDEETRQAVTEAKNLAADEVIVYNSKAVVHVKADGSVEIKSAGGTAVELALKSDNAAIISAISGAAVVALDGGAALKANILLALVGIPVGTTKLKGE